MAKKKKNDYFIDEKVLLEYYKAAIKDDLECGVISQVTYNIKMNSPENYNEFKKSFFLNPESNEIYYKEIYEKRMGEISELLDRVKKSNTTKKEFDISTDEFDDLNFSLINKKVKRNKNKDSDSSIDSIDDFLDF